MHTIELDCPPGNPRPDDLLPEALMGTDLTPNDFVVESKFFGNWTFVLKAELDDKYLWRRDRIKENITALYDAGLIRYASW